MTFEQFLVHIQTLLVDNRLEDIIQFMLDISKKHDQELVKRIVLVRTRLKRAIHHYHQGTISQEDYGVEQNRIVHSILYFQESFKAFLPKTKLHDSEPPVFELPAETTNQILERRLIVSHSTADQEKVKPILEELKNLHYKDVHLTLEEADEERLANVASQMTRFGAPYWLILFLSSSYIKEQKKRSEDDYILNIGLLTNASKVLLVVIDEVNIPLTLKDRQVFRFTNTFDTALELASNIEEMELVETDELRHDYKNTLIQYEDYGKEVEWENVQDYLIPILLEELLDNLHLVADENQPEIPFSVELTRRKCLTLFVSSLMIRNDSFMAGLRNKLEIFKAQEFLVNELLRELTEDGLGVFRSAFKLRLKKTAQKRQQSLSTLREQLSSVAEVITLHEKPKSKNVI